VSVVPPPGTATELRGGDSEANRVEQDLLRAKQLRREVSFQELPAGEFVQQVAALAKPLDCDMIVVGKLETSAL